MEFVKKWLADHSISAHTFTAVAGTLLLLYSADVDVRNGINDLAAGHPAITKLIALGALVYARYAASQPKG